MQLHSERPQFHPYWLWWCPSNAVGGFFCFVLFISYITHRAKLAHTVWMRCTFTVRLCSYFRERRQAEPGIQMDERKGNDEEEEEGKWGGAGEYDVKLKHNLAPSPTPLPSLSLLTCVQKHCGKLSCSHTAWNLMFESSLLMGSRYIVVTSEACSQREWRTPVIHWIHYCLRLCSGVDDAC